MKVLASVSVVLLLSLSSLVAGTLTNDIIPTPKIFHSSKGLFTLTERTEVTTATPLSDNALIYLQRQLALNAGYTLKKSRIPHSHTINYMQNATMDEEAYTLLVRPGSIRITANSISGFFYATVSLMQLMDHQIWSQERSDIPQTDWNIPACYVEDRPDYKWRGMMLDTARNFFSVNYVKKFIDRMAQHKLNLFHWHLTDDEGWRIETKSYPMLTRTGAVRGPGTALPFSLYPAMRGPKEKIQKGFYTQKEILDIVDYAAKRSVHVLPEIDMPAHAKAAVMSYPELLQDPNDTSRYISVQKISDNTIDPGLESTYIFMEKVIEEVSVLFPFDYIHLGGDEIPQGAWQNSPAVARLKQKEHLDNNAEVEGYFFTKMEKILAAYNRKLIGWQEIGEHQTRLRDDTIVMAWKGNGREIEALHNGNKVVMSPASKLYFDQQYVKSTDEPGHTWAGPTDTEEVYAYNPATDLNGAEASTSIIGVHACLWSERLFNEQLADYMTWPRALALSEIAWNGDRQRRWPMFKERAFGNGLQRLEQQKINFRVPKP